MILVILIGFMVLAFGLAFFVFLKLALKKDFDAKALQYMQSHWVRILDMFPNNPKAAILDADKLLDYALAKKGVEGSLGEKLKKSGGKFSDLNGVWAAHKLRNQVAHDLSEIDQEAARRALKNFKRALNDLGAGL